ncbi:hypothetical protein ANANG_G00064400, partial [Anguilla anguilla]
MSVRSCAALLQRHQQEERSVEEGCRNCRCLWYPASQPATPVSSQPASQAAGPLSVLQPSPPTQPPIGKRKKAQHVEMSSFEDRIVRALEEPTPIPK